MNAMSVFGDFRNVWIQRFPGSDLPAAWEEDVRANLSKHRQRVAVLKEELEKEEFYVEYLERLLNDVEKHKTKDDDDDAASESSDLFINKDLNSSSDSLDSRVKSEEQISDSCKANDNVFDKKDPVQETVSHSVSLPADHRISRSASDVPKGSNDSKRPRSNTHPDISKYVTVIEVDGLNEAKKAEQKRGNEKPKLAKKVPPIPPPKKYSKFTSGVSLSSTNESGEAQEPVNSEAEELKKKVNSSEVSDDTCDRLLDEEPYYDSVTMDGEYVYLQSGEVSSTMTSGTSSGTADTDDCASLPRSSPFQKSGSEMHITSISPGKQSNYVNIDYFIKQQADAGAVTRNSSVESEDEEVPVLLRTISVDGDGSEDLYSNFSYASSHSSLESSTPGVVRKSSIQANKAEAERMTMYRCIIASIVESETLYLDCLNIMIQYMKAIKAALSTSQPVVTEEEFNTMFYKIPELHALHHNFLNGLKKRTQNWDGRLTIGDHFHIMASNINVYGAFLHNYGRATDTIKKCSANSQQFAEITRDIKLKSLAGQSVSLEDLLHKPVARVQKNALVLHDLLRYTPESHPDFQTLSEALKMTQNFLDEFNMIQTKTMFPSADRAQRRLVKNSFIVELVDGHRKLRHLFLFNDVLACAKYKASGRDKFTFELKWYIPLCDIVIFEEPAVEPKESSPINIVSLKSQACTVRDQILLEEKDEKRPRNRSEKQRKKLADLEAQLVLASPNLVFRVGNRNSKTYTFFLSSEFERTQWIEAVHALQSSQLPSPNVSVSMYELQAWITACRTFLKTNMGSYLLRTGRDESLLVGDLHLQIKDLFGLSQPADLFVCIEVDSYGHYFRKAKSKLVCNSTSPRWNEEFVIDLEGSQNLRVLLYEESQDRAMLRGKYTQKLSRSWLSEVPLDKVIPFQNSNLNINLKFVANEITLRRVPAARAGGLFGAKIQQVCKRQKRDIPFIITSCVREVERRGMNEVGIYRVSGSASDLSRLKKSFETNSYEAEQLLKEVDIHSVTGILKLYLRELPEALFTDELYPRFLEAFTSGGGELTKQKALQQIFSSLPAQNQNIINFLLSHLIKINRLESQNKMSLHNLATVFGPTLLRPASGKVEAKHKESLTTGTVDVMAQAGILYYFLQRMVRMTPE